ncbi:ormdl family protein [Tubulinosema ratisbonensis]|uniref:Ormdl family protein n=1 Tax=Tubulinosema ratisbonensis TaxID=291195 RepID=A0A437AKX9_9MICR|nr:ormdl family protein [Tubulinosema ratisbonensis]
MSKGHHSGLSQNIAWTTFKGSCLIHPLVTASTSTLFAMILGWNLAMQLTVVFYNFITFIFLHWIIGDPFEDENCLLTFWEQMVEQIGSSDCMMFMLAYPCLLFVFTNWFVVWNDYLFFVAVFSLCLVVIPKLRFMHKKRLFGIRDFS